jgi:hypothetical protein
MPPRGTPSLWPVRILTDFGKSAYVLWLLAAMLFVVAIVSPRLRGTSRSLLLGLGTRLQFMFFAVLVPVLVGEVIKWIVGRGRPFVGGEGQRLQLLISPEPKPMPAFHRAMPSRALRWLSRFRGVAAGADRDAGLCGRDRAHPSGAAGPSPQRRGRGRIDRRDRRDVRAILVRGPPAGPSRSAATARLCRLPDPRWAPQKGCPRARSPHKKRTPQSTGSAVPAPPTQP